MGWELCLQCHNVGDYGYMSTETLAGGNKFTTNSSGLTWDTVTASKSIVQKTGGVARVTVDDTGVTLSTPLPIASGGTGVTSLSSTPAAGAVVVYDANKAVSADSFITTYQSTQITVTATNTFTVASKQLQRFWGSAGAAAAYTIVLPSTATLAAGQSFTIINESTSVISVYNTASASLIGTLQASTDGIAQFGNFVNTISQGWARDMPVQYDDNANIVFNNMVQGFQTTAIGLTLTEASPYITYVTGAGGVTFTLPSTAGLALGHRFAVMNGSAGTVAVQTSTSAAVLTQVAASDAQYMVVSTAGDTAAAWKYLYSLASSTGTVTSVAASVPSFLSVSGSPITTSGTLAISLSGTALPVLNGGTGVTSLSSTPVANTIVNYNANKQVTADNFTTGYTSTAVTVDATVTLTNASTEVQRFTGSAASTVILTLVLPSTVGLAAGHTFTVINDSTSTVKVYNTASAALLVTLEPTVDGGNRWTIFRQTGLQLWTHCYPVQYDDNENITFNNMVQGFQSTAVGVTLTEASPYITYVTGAGGITITLPSTAGLALGHRFAVMNGSAGTVAVQTSTSAAVLTQVTASDAQYMVVSTAGNTAAAWKYLYSLASSTGTVTSVAASVPSFLSVSGSPITTSGTLAISLSGTALPIANGGTGATTAVGTATANTYASYDTNRTITADHFSTGRTTLSVTAGQPAGTFAVPTVIAAGVTMIQLSALVAETGYFAREFVNIIGANTFGASSTSLYDIQLPTHASLNAGTSYLLTNGTGTNGVVNVYDSTGAFLAQIGNGDSARFTDDASIWITQKFLKTNSTAAINNGSAIKGAFTATRLYHTSTSTVTSATTLALTADSTSFQRSTGSTAGFAYSLPSLTSQPIWPIGGEFTILNEASVSVNVYLPDGTTLLQTLAQNQCMKFMSRGITDIGANWIRTPVLFDSGVSGGIYQSNGTTQNPTFKAISALGIAFTDITGTLAINKGGTGQTAIVTAPAASTIPAWDASLNLSANNFLAGLASITSAAGTTVLTIASARIQVVTGSTTQTITLPATYAAGTSFRVINNSTGKVTVQSSGTNVIATLLGSTSSDFVGVTANGTTAADWESTYDNIDNASAANTSWTPTLEGSGGVSVYASRDANYSTTVSGTTSTAIGRWVKATAKIVMTSYHATAASSQLLTLTLPVAAGANAYTTVTCMQGDIATPTNGFTTHVCPCALTSASSSASVVINFTPTAADIWYISLDYQGTAF